MKILNAHAILTRALIFLSTFKVIIMKKLFISLGAVLVAVLMLLLYFTAFAPKKTEGEKEVTVKICYADNNFTYNVKTNAQTVEELLKEVDEVYGLELNIEEGFYGSYITSMKGVSQNEEKGYYYTYTVSGVEFASGISTQTFKGGDVIEFRYEYTEYDESYNVISTTLIGKGNTAKYVKAEIIIISIACVLAFSGIAYGVAVLIKGRKNEK